MGHDPALVEGDDHVGRGRFLGPVGDMDHPDATGGRLPHERHQLGPPVPVDHGGRLVGEEQ